VLIEVGFQGLKELTAQAIARALWATLEVTALAGPEWSASWLFFRCFISGSRARCFRPVHSNPPSILTDVHVLFSYRCMAADAQVLPYRIRAWDDHEIRVEEVIALVSNHGVARAAFAEAIKRRPGKIITLRQKSRVLSDSRE
jgi:hypothetical protein